MNTLKDINDVYQKLETNRSVKDLNKTSSHNISKNTSYVQFCEKYSIYGNVSYTTDCKTP